jgi:hypothetical protein
VPIREQIPSPDELPRFLKTPPGRQLSAHEIAEGQQLFLIRGIIATQAPLRTEAELVTVYNEEVRGGDATLRAPELSVEQFSEFLDRFSFLRNDLEARRFSFRESFRAALHNADSKGGLGEVLRRFCDEVGDGSLEPRDLQSMLVREPELRRDLDARLARDLVEHHGELLPELAEMVATRFGDRISEFSLTEVGELLRRDDPIFSDAVVVKLFETHPKEFAGAPADAGRKNFMLAVTVAHAMDKMWPGASHQDVVEFLHALGPHAQVPAHFDAQHLELLGGYEFIPAWPNGIKPTDSAGVELETLARECAPTLNRMASGERDLFLAELGEWLEKRRVPSPADFDALVHRHSHEAFGEEALAFFRRCVESSTNDKASRSLFERRLRTSAAACGPVDGVPDELQANARLISTVMGAIRDGRVDELLDAPHWRGELRTSATAEGRQPGDVLFDMLSEFHEKTTHLARSAELASFRARARQEANTNFEKVPRVLPTTQSVVEAALGDAQQQGAGRPFDNVRAVMVQHQLGQAFAQVDAYRQLGLDPSHCTFIGKPYHPNPEVERALIDALGVDGRFFARGDLETMAREAERAVDQAIAARKPGEVVLVVGDGPGIRRYVKERYIASDPSMADWIRFTEQTSFGHRDVDVREGGMRVVSYARSRQKVLEAPYIARASVRAIERVLGNLRDSLEHKTVWVNGIRGPIGKATAEALAAVGARVMGHDPKCDAELVTWAEERGIEVSAEDAKLPKDAFMVVGAAGAESIDAQQIERTGKRSDGGPTYYVSVSSDFVEIDRARLAKDATVDGNLRKMVATYVNEQPTYYYWLSDGSVRTVVGDGQPANFQDVNSVAPEYIDATMAMSLASAVEAVQGKDLGFISLSRYVDVIEKKHEPQS